MRWNRPGDSTDESSSQGFHKGKDTYKPDQVNQETRALIEKMLGVELGRELIFY